MRGRYFIITSQDDPDTTFQHGDDGSGHKRPLENIGQIIRRLDKLVEFSAYYDSERRVVSRIRTDRTDEFKRKFNVIPQGLEEETLNIEKIMEEWGIE